MPDSSRSPAAPVTDFLRAWSGGDRAALDAVIPLVHAELKRLARRHLAGERANHSIQPTALVNLFYLSPDGGLMSVALTASDVVRPGRPNELFRTHLATDRSFSDTSYAVTADGRRFLLPTVVRDPPQPAVTMMLNWSNALQR